MQAKVIFLRGRTRLPLEDSGSPEHPIEVVVPYTDPALAAQTLEAAAELARGFEAAVTLMAVHVLPYPSPLECQEGIRQRLEAELTAVARTSSVAIRVKLAFARDRADAYMGLLPRHSLVLIGSRSRWWKTREERLARRLSVGGHSVAMLKVR